MEIKKQKIMHGVKKTFDKWAQNGRAELMDKDIVYVYNRIFLSH